jgi:protein phosphatase
MPSRDDTLLLSFGVKTDVGTARTENEDSFEIVIPAPRDGGSSPGSLFVVADGMGGHAAGAVASQIAVNTLSAIYYADPESPAEDRLLRAFTAAHDSVIESASHGRGRLGMGCTLVAAAFVEDLVIVNVGDSRAYLWRDGELEQITEDHSLVSAQVRAGLMTEEAARCSPFRSALTQCIGSQIDLEPDVFHREVRPGDVLLLCSDGLHDPLSPDDIREELVRGGSPTEITRALVRRAAEAGSHDNITAVCVLVRGCGPEAG